MSEAASVVTIAGMERWVWEAIEPVSVAVVRVELAVVSAAAEGTHFHRNGHGSPGRGDDRRQMGQQQVVSAISSRRNCLVGGTKATDFCGHDTLRSAREGPFRRLFTIHSEV